MAIKDKVALITGTGQAIGQAIALRPANDNVNVAIIEFDDEKMQSDADGVRKIGRKARVDQVPRISRAPRRSRP